MGRRSFISVTTINKLISASNRRKREKEREALISAQEDVQKELPPQYTLHSVDFNRDTRMTKIEILQTKKYRTIDRYVTQNYVRYPIFSGWKIKNKIIKKTLKLTNYELENLKYNSDALISSLAFDIILSLNEEEFFPSWFIKNCLQNEYDEKLKCSGNEYKKYVDNQNEIISKNQLKIIELQQNIEAHKKILNDYYKRQKKLEKKLKKIEQRKKSVFFYILTFGIFAYLKSNKRKNRLSNKLSLKLKEIKTVENTIEIIQLDISNLEHQNNEINHEISIKYKEYIKNLRHEKSVLDKKIAQVTPLPTDLQYDSNFITLNSFIGYDYEKIIGCYLIHNIKNDKYYVGQSKDIMKRIHQHFRGTVPINIIFAEDYYATPQIERNNLFEVQIIQCTTKDELDKTEKYLIEKYDAFKSGYNSTNGNK